MIDNAFQETLFAEPIGLQLKHAREKIGLKMSDASARLKLPLVVIEALEREDWQKLGAPIYARSYLSSYLKLLDLPTVMANEVRFDTAPASSIKLLSEKPVRRDIDKTLSTLAYFAITGVILTLLGLLAVHFQAPKIPNAALPLDIQMQAAQAPIEKATSAIATTGVSDSPTAASEPPVMASLTPTVVAANTGGWEIRVNGDSWMEIVGVDGQRIESGIVSAGVIKQFKADEISRMTIGNADEVQLFRNGQAVNFSAFKQDNVARFKISGDGSLVAITIAN